MQKRENLTIKHYLNEKKRHKAGAKIIMQIGCGKKGPGRKAELYTGFGCSKENWSSEKQKVVKGHLTEVINRELTALESEAYQAKSQLEHEGKAVNGAAIKQVMKGEVGFDKLLVDYFAQHIEEIEQKKNDYAEGTVKTYKTSIKHLSNYLKYSHQQGITLKNVDYRFITGYDHYLRTQVRNRRLELIDNNTVVKQHTKLRTLMIKAAKEEYVRYNPYRDFKLSVRERKVVALRKEELQTIRDLKLPERLDRVRDIFIFSCFTGLRFSDASSLTMARIKRDSKGRMRLQMEAQKKTGEPLYVPVAKEAKRILDRYDDSNERSVLGLALPRITNQKSLTTYRGTNSADYLNSNQRLPLKPVLAIFKRFCVCHPCHGRGNKQP